MIAKRFEFTKGLFIGPSYIIINGKKRRMPNKKSKKWSKGKVHPPLWACWTEKEIENARKEAKRIAELFWH